MKRHLTNIWGDKSAAVAPTVALSLFALIGAGGLAFDYARMASMDTELQNAADQAALAAATQLDQQTGAIARATAAAQGLLTNQTLFANDSSGMSVSVPTIVFYANKTDAEADNGTDCPTVGAVTDSALARFVCVRTANRTANFALTPIVAAFSSGNLAAMAVAGLGSAICKTPPVMMCNPSEPEGNANDDYPISIVPGSGIKLVVGAPSAPGNFGFLQTGFGTGAQALAKAIGYNTPPADCAATNGVDTEPGDKESVRAAFNTRFDMSESGQTCPGTGACSPSQNSRKDLVKGNNCGTSGNQGWEEAVNPYRPSSPTVPLDGTNDPEIMGFPRDMCHAVSLDGLCETDGNLDTNGDSQPDGDIIGDGTWDRDAYFRVNYGWDNSTWQTNTSLGPTATRYQVYQWEMTHQSTVQSAGADVQTMANGKTGHMTPVCRPPGVTPNLTTPDRRRISVAVINCEAQGLGGREYGVQVLKWVDVFLVEPAIARPQGGGPSARTGNGDIYVEMIGEVQTGAGSTAGQVVRRDVPYLVK